MALTKTQIRYLEDKLSRVVNEKIRKFKSSLGDDKYVEKEILTKLKQGTIKLLPDEQIIKMFSNTIDNKNYYYTSSFTIDMFISKKDRDKINSEVSKYNSRLSNYSDKLLEVKENILDNIVLRGIDIETAIKELDKVE